MWIAIFGHKCVQIWSFWACLFFRIDSSTEVQKMLSVVEVLPVFGHVVVKYTVIVDVLLFNGFAKA